MDTATIKLLTQVARAGASFSLVGDRVRVTGDPGPELRHQLAEHRDRIYQLLLPDTCANCGTPAWIREHATHIPWCRPCTRQRGHQLLRHEHPQHHTQENP